MLLLFTRSFVFNSFETQLTVPELVAISFSRGSSQPKDLTQVSCLAGGFFTTEPPGKSGCGLAAVSAHEHFMTVNKSSTICDKPQLVCSCNLRSCSGVSPVDRNNKQSIIGTCIEGGYRKGSILKAGLHLGLDYGL